MSSAPRDGRSILLKCSYGVGMWWTHSNHWGQPAIEGLEGKANPLPYAWIEDDEPQVFIEDSSHFCNLTWRPK